MSAPEYNTWQGDPGNGIVPRRPSTDDMGGDDLQDDQEKPPVEGEMATAAAWDQIVKQIASLARTAHSCGIEVKITAGTPAVTRAWAPNPSIVPATFTPLDNGPGDTSVTWPPNTFPESNGPPTGLTILSNSTATTSIRFHVEEIANGIRVRTSINGAAADLDWSINLN